MRIYTIRHGRTSWDAEGRIKGAVDVPLDRVGIKQSLKTADFFDNIKFDCVYSATLQRAARTAEIVTRNRYPLIKCDDLNERDFGRWQGKLWTQIYREHPKLKEIWETEGVNFAPEDGETLESLIKRSQIRFLEIIKNHGTLDTVLISSHGGPLKAILGYVWRTPWEQVPDIAKIENCGISIIENNNGLLEVSVVDVIAY